ncbi:tetratricopeptide repeat-containing sulfotransferase family protein [Thalassotalea sp. PS06]|uniref:tetratricopeptide repeat-containing sulfotransferase family protein n=1 Tax=Thalassotalea sp. PS06 TaxID=2594005 RepID=UPI001C8F4805|nr:tetratricopeptide repeat-containing sulfotransferase family protein [Thalassotalea sp. PS06]
MTQSEIMHLIQRGQKLLASGQSREAYSIGLAAVANSPDSTDSHLLVAIAAQQLKKLEIAFDSITKVIKLNPNIELAHVVRANISSQLNSVKTTVELCKNSIQYFPNNSQIWFQLSQSEYKLNNHASADTAFKKHLVLSASSPVLGEALKQFFKQDFLSSEKAVRQHLNKHPNDVSALRLLGEIALNLGVFDDAQRLFEKALSLAPKYSLARLNYAHVLTKRERNKEALKQIQLLEKQQPNHPPILTIKAATLVKLGRYKESISLYQELLEAQPNQPELWASLGHTYKTTGEKQKCVSAYLNALKFNPDYGDAYWSLANLKTYEFNEEQVTQMHQSYARCHQHQNENLAQICFALAKALESKKKIDESFSYYQIGNQIKSELEPYDRKELEQLVQRSKAYFNREKISAISTLKHSKPHKTTPIFIVGLPRSGSTLLEQILATHSQVDGTKELADIVSLARKLGNRKKKQDNDEYPQSIAKLTEREKWLLGQEYINSSAHLRNDAPYFIDKMPNNFQHIGLIKTILPNAKIIDARRNPVASGFSCYKQLFATGQNFSYDLKNIQHYYQHYLLQMEFWQSCFPDDIITIQYENVIHQTEQQIRKLLEFLNLNFEVNCLDFYKNERAVATASAEQVRQPINTKGLDAWQPYQHHLSILLSI